jgi:CMP-N-acetylneuraminic acid synthetase
MEHKIIAVLGLRSGSKGVPNKNIRMLGDKRLFEWVGEAAKNSKLIDRVIVSTDSEEYRSIAIKCGYEAPFLRPDKYATDNSPEYDYIKDLVLRLERVEGYRPDIIVRIHATSPMQHTLEIDQTIQALIDNTAWDSSVVIAEARQNPMKALRIIEDNGIKKLLPYFSDNGREVTPIGRQNYTTPYYRANVITSRYETIMNTGSLTGDNIYPVIIPQERALDIDSEFDFKIANLILNNILEN